MKYINYGYRPHKVLLEDDTHYVINARWHPQEHDDITLVRKQDFPVIEDTLTEPGINWGTRHCLTEAIATREYAKLQEKYGTVDEPRYNQVLEVWSIHYHY